MSNARPSAPKLLFEIKDNRSFTFKVFANTGLQTPPVVDGKSIYVSPEMKLKDMFEYLPGGTGKRVFKLGGKDLSTLDQDTTIAGFKKTEIKPTASRVQATPTIQTNFKIDTDALKRAQEAGGMAATSGIDASASAAAYRAGSDSRAAPVTGVGDRSAVTLAAPLPTPPLTVEPASEKGGAADARTVAAAGKGGAAPVTGVAAAKPSDTSLVPGAAPSTRVTARLRSRSTSLSSDEDEDLTFSRARGPQHLALASAPALFLAPSLSGAFPKGPGAAGRPKKTIGKKGAAAPQQSSILEYLSALSPQNGVEATPLARELQKQCYVNAAVEKQSGELKYTSGTEEVASISQNDSGNYKITIKKGPAIVAINLKNEAGEETDKQIVISYNKDGKVDKIVPSELEQQRGDGQLKTRDHLFLPFTPEEYGRMVAEADSHQKTQDQAHAQAAAASTRLTREDMPRNRDRHHAQVRRGRALVADFSEDSLSSSVESRASVKSLSGDDGSPSPSPLARRRSLHTVERLRATLQTTRPSALSYPPRGPSRSSSSRRDPSHL